MSVYFDSSYLTINWNEDLDCVEMQWKEYVKGEPFRNGLNKGLELLKERGGHRWLADMRHMKVVGEKDQKWSYEEWFPKALEVGVKSMALVMPRSLFARMSVDLIMSEVRDSRLVTQHFDDITRAKVWLETH